MPEGIEARYSTVECQNPPFINSCRPRVPSAVLALGVLCPTHPRRSRQAITENYSSGHVAERVGAQQVLGGSGPGEWESS